MTTIVLFMRFPIISLLVCPLLASAQTIPRLTQISPNPEIPHRQPVIRDLSADGFPDIIFPSAASENYGLAVVNLGNRQFADPAVTHYRQSVHEAYDADASVIELNGLADFHLFFNQSQALSDGSSTPVGVSFGSFGAYGKRSALGPSGPGNWVPVELDGDHVSEFLQYGSSTELRLWTRQPDGNYTSTALSFDRSVSMDRASAVDLDSDGDLDLVIQQTNNPSLLIERTGPRAFSSKPLEISFNGTQMADLNGDGLPDFYEINSASIRWRENLGGISWGAIQTTTLPSVVENSDFFQISDQSGSAAQIVFHTRRSTGIDIQILRFGTWEVISEQEIFLEDLRGPVNTPELLAIEDFDRDGKPDALIGVDCSFANRPYLFSVRRLAIAWDLGAKPAPAVYIQPALISNDTTLLGDFNGDHLTDLILGPDTDGSYWFLANQNNGKFPIRTRLTGIDPPANVPANTFISSIQAMDIDGDAILDLAVTYGRQVSNGYQSACGIARGLGNGTFVPPSLPPGSFDLIVECLCGTGELIDWDKDGDLDLIGGGIWRENLGGYFSSETRILLGGALTTDAFGNPVTFVGTTAKDIDGDGFPDIVSHFHRIESSSATPSSLPLVKNYSAVGFNDGKGGIAEIVEFPLSLVGADAFGNQVTGSLTIEDLNSDGWEDLCTSEFTATDVFGNPVLTNYWLRNPRGANARNPATWVKTPLTAVLPTASSFLDFDGDGQREWVSLTGYLRASPSGPLNSPTYRFTGNVAFQSGSTHFYADFDGDGDADFLIGEGALNLTLVQNPLIDENNAITRFLVKAGATGQKATCQGDADGDGRDNLTELLFGTDPVADDAQPANPLEVQLHHSGSSAAISFQIPAYATDLSLKYEVQRSTNLIDWSPLDDSAIVLRSHDGEWSFLNLPIDHSEGSAYFRIKGKEQPEDN